MYNKQNKQYQVIRTSCIQEVLRIKQKQNNPGAQEKPQDKNEQTKWQQPT